MKLYMLFVIWNSRLFRGYCQGSQLKRVNFTLFFQNGTDYRYSVLFKIPALVELDLIPVSAEEKVFSQMQN